MRTLYTFDKHNYSDDMEVFERFAVRAVIIRDGKLAMQQAGEGYYKILGGGIDAGETNEVALEIMITNRIKNLRKCLPSTMS